jgi:hypothetical protein
MGYQGGTSKLRKAAPELELRPMTENLAIYKPNQAKLTHAAEKAALSKGNMPSKPESRWCCRACRTDLGLISTNYKLACRRYDAPIQSANPNIGDWRRYIDDEPVFRQFFCPGCGRLIENEIARKSDELLHDIELITK